MNRPIILCGLGRVGWHVLEFLRAAELPVVVIDDDHSPEDPRLGEALLVRGDCRRRDVLEKAGVRNCDGVLILTSDDLVNVSAALMVRSLNRDVRMVVRVFNEGLIGRLGNAIHNIFPLSTSALTAPLLAVKALTGQALGTFRVAGERQQITEFNVNEASHLLGRTLKELVTRYGVHILVHAPAIGTPRFLTDIDLKARLVSGDRVGVCGEPAELTALLTASEEERLRLRWASWLRRSSRAFWRTIREIEWPVLVCMALLIGVLLMGTLVFFFVQDRRLGDALYHTVSVMATMADMGGERDTDELKAFTSILRILGTVLLAAFTAILTNYLVRASLGGALEVRRIPDAGHLVVCGLGAIGYQVVEELLHAKERVVAVEVDKDNLFISPLRARGVPVIVGDASLDDVMRRTHAATARAVIACTSNDLVNLETALLARQLNPKQRVVLLQSDPQLAELLRVAANVRLAVSVPVLAAPAFVAGLFGERVLSVFLMHEQLFAVMDLVIQAQDTHLAGQTARTLAVDNNVLPVAVVPTDGSPLPRNPLAARLSAGDRLILVIALKDMERFLRRQAAPREWIVDITAIPEAAREWLTLFVQRSRQLTPEAASQALDTLPFSLGEQLTRGQALDLLALLERERIEGRMRKQGA